MRTSERGGGRWREEIAWRSWTGIGLAERRKMMQRSKEVKRRLGKKKGLRYGCGESKGT